MVASSKTGFTLVELLIAAAAGLLLSGFALGVLVALQQLSQQTDERLIQEAELQRALRYMTADIQEGQRLDSTVPPQSGFKGLFRIVRPDGSAIAYYTAPRGNRVWSGPHILYRRDSREALTYALVDQLAHRADLAGTPDTLCPGSEPLIGSEAGVMVRLNPTQNTAQICLFGALSQSSAEVSATTLAATRIPPSPEAP